MRRLLKKIGEMKKQEEGFTLVEVIITMLIFSIVVAAIFSFMNFGLDSFNLGVDKADEMAELRLTSLELTNELRNVFTVDVLTVAPDPATTEFVYFSSGNIVLNDNGSTTNLSSSILTGFDAELDLVNNKYVLLIRLEGETTELETKILLNNIQATDTVGEATGTIVQFSTTPN